MDVNTLRLGAEEKEYELVVIGGGISGMCAAIAAARLGVKTALVHDRPVLGGNASSEMRVGISSAVCSGKAIARQARETGIVEELGLECMARNPRYDAAFCVQDIIFLESVKNEKLVDLYLNCRAVNTICGDDNRIVKVGVVSNITEKSFLLKGDYFIDASGDGQIAFSAGAEFMYGQESRDEYGESFAPPTGSKNVMSPSVFFTARNVGHNVEYTMPSWAYDFPSDEDLPFRDHNALDMLGTPYEGTGFWWMEFGGILDTVNQADKIYEELIKILFGIWDHLKNHGDHGMDNYTLCWFNSMPAKRESRRFIGDVIVTQHDIENATLFPDRVAYAGWPIDVHPPEGIFSPDPPCTSEMLSDVWNIPFRCLYSKNVPNLMMAGRNVSVTHIALGSIRIMATCGLMGQAVGTATSLCKKYGTSPRVLCNEHIEELQQLLLKNDCYIKEIRDNDPHNLVRKARVHADSDAALDIAGPSKPYVLDKPVAQLFPVTSDRIETISLYLSTASPMDQCLKLSLLKAVNINNFTDSNSIIANTNAAIPAKTEGWIDLHIDALVEPGCLYWIKMEANSNISWYYTDAPPPPGTNCSILDSTSRRWKATKAAFLFRLYPQSHPFIAANVINGIHRAEKGSNVWISDPTQKLPQSLTLEFDEIVAINSIRISFDSSLDENIYLPEPWGKYGSNSALSTIVKDYSIDVMDGTGYRNIARIEGNYLRHKMHRFERVDVKAIRITVEKTNGDLSARIFEVRCYLEND